MSYYPLISLMPKAAAFDPDAQAFITAAGITNPTQQGAINTLVLALKGYSIWTKFKAIYPIVGGSASTHKWNLKDPRDLDAAFRLTFATGWTHSSNGMLPNGFTFANTFFKPSTEGLTYNNNHLSYYSRTSTAYDFYDMGSGTTGNTDILSLWIRRTANTSGYDSGAFPGNRLTVANLDGKGFYNNTSPSTTAKIFKNGVSVASKTNSASSISNINVQIGGFLEFGGPYYYGNKECAFASIGYGLTDTEAANFYTAVQAYQTTLGRSIGTQTVSDADAQAFVTAAAIDDQVQATAINNLVIGLKADSLWTKMKAIYPIVGGTASSHAVNLKTPGTYNMTFATGWTHSSTGMTPNGATYANTAINVNSVMTLDSMAFGIYSRTNSAGSATGHGAGAALQNSCFIVERWTDNVSYAQVNTTTNTSLAVTDSSGFYQVSRTASNAVRLVRNTTHATSTAASTAKPNLFFLFGARSTDLSNNTFQNGSREIAFGYLSDGLTQTECDNFYTRVNTYQTALSRNV